MSHLFLELVVKGVKADICSLKLYWRTDEILMNIDDGGGLVVLNNVEQVAVVSSFFILTYHLPSNSS